MATRYFCDTDCELWYTEVEKLGIETIKMPYILDGVEYLYDFGRETDFEHFYKRLKEGAMPTTAALNEYDYTQYFEPIFAAGDDIFYIAFSSQMSGTFGSMHNAVNELKAKYPNRKFIYFDTLSISMGAGMQVYYAMQLKNSGASDDEVLAFLQDFTKHVETLFSVDDLHHLKRGGRLSPTAATIGTLLNLKPILTINDEGKIKPIAKVNGLNLVMKYFVNEITKNAVDLDKYDVWIMHADCLDRAEKLKARIEEATGGKANVRIILVGPVIGAHCGAGTLAVIFPSKQR
ncbi:MAG: DegV family protein [Clostridia bacterium]